jgi:hypothetical protein
MIELVAGDARATVYLPDADAGRYRGQRFDWSGMVGNVTAARHAFMGPWWPTAPDPASHDQTAIGTADEFGIDAAPGYADAAPGTGTFVKIGVGRLRRGAGDPYQFWTRYAVVDRPPWTIEHGPNWAAFRHVLPAAADGYAYDYVKRVELTSGPGGAARLVIRRSLSNTGHRPIDTEHYTHNFITIDAEPVGPDYTVRFPFPVQIPDQTALRGLAEPDGPTLRFVKPVPAKATAYARLADVPPTAAMSAATVTNTRTGGTVRVSVDLPTRQACVYATARVVCPEMFVRILVEPGKQVEWATTYDFGSDVRRVSSPAPESNMPTTQAR